MHASNEPGMGAGAFGPGSGRDERGRFAQGNSGGAGNPFARRVAQMRQALLQAVSDEDLQELVQALLLRAKSGDVAAARLVLSYTVGKPAATQEPDRMDVQEVQLYKESFTDQEILHLPLHGMQADLVCFLMRALAPGMRQENLKFMREYLQAQQQRMQQQEEKQQQRQARSQPPSKTTRAQETLEPDLSCRDLPQDEEDEDLDREQDLEQEEEEQEAGENDGEDEEEEEGTMEGDECQSPLPHGPFGGAGTAGKGTLPGGIPDIAGLSGDVLRLRMGWPEQWPPTKKE